MACEQATGWKIQRLGAALGALVENLDLSVPLTQTQRELFQGLLDEHLVVCVKGQDGLTPKQQIAFTEGFGECFPHPLGSRADSHPAGMPREVMVAQNTLRAGDAKGRSTVRNDIWHSALLTASRRAGRCDPRHGDVSGEGLLVRSASVFSPVMHP